MSHYSNAQNPDELYRNAALQVEGKLIPAYNDRADVRPVLCYRGMSGVAAATAVRLYLHLNHPLFTCGMLYVRKLGEKSHGDAVEIEYPDRWDMNEAGCSGLEAVFVDDFICSGTTLREVHDAARRKHPEIIWSRMAPVLCLTPGYEVQPDRICDLPRRKIPAELFDGEQLHERP